jgi:hypothetical protein
VQPVPHRSKHCSNPLQPLYQFASSDVVLRLAGLARSDPARARLTAAPTIFNTKKSAARGSPLAAIGIDYNRICSLPLNLYEQTSV